MTASVLAYIPSPSQGVWHLGPVPLRAYALCIIVGIVAALIIGDRRWAERGGERGVIYDIALWAVPFGLVGGRLYHVMTDWRTYFGDDGAGFFAAFKIWDGGLGIWGAVALGGVGAWIGCRQRGIPLPAFGDAIAPGIVLAQAIGRLGNYFNQELYGRPTTLPWGLEIFERRNTAGALDSLNGVSTGQLVEVVHPTFLYELLWNVLVFAVLIWVDRRFKIGHGRLFALYVAAYCVGRFWVELMRSDMATHIAGIRVNTFTSTFVFIAAVVYIMVAPKGREDPATLRGNAVDDEDSPVDELGEELAAVAATSGVVAAAKVAGDEDRPATTPAPGGQDAAESAADAEPDAGLGLVEGDEAVEAEVAAPEVHEAAVDAAEDAEALAEDAAAEADAEDAQGAEVEPKAEVGPEPEAEAEADAEPEAEVKDEAEAGVEPESEPEAGPEPEEGLGSVEGDELVEAQDDVPEVLAAAVEGTAAAEALAAEPEAEAVGGEAVASEAAAEAEDLTEQVATAPSEDIAEAEAFAAAGAAADAEPEAGLGSVEGDEAVEAETAAPEVHQAAVDAAEDAEALAEDVAAEAASAEPEDGLGSVEGDEVAEAQEDAAEVHEAVAEGADEAEALADDVAAGPEKAEPEAVAEAPSAEPELEPEAEAASPEPAPDAEPEPEDGLGSVEGDETAEAEAEVQETAAEGADEAEDVAAQPKTAEPKTAAAESVTTQSVREAPRRRWWQRRG